MIVARQRSAAPALAGRVRRLVDPAALLALPVLLLLGYLVRLALDAQPAQLGQTLLRLDLLDLLARMTLLSTAATVLALALGVPWAWLVARTNVPGRRLFQALGPLPLAIPPYVGALAYASLLAPGGLVHQTLAGAAGVRLSELPYPAAFYSPLGAAFVLGVFSAPYVFVTVQGAILRLSPALEESARSLGLAPRAVFWRVTLPSLRPALLAGGFLVFLYAWVDFGVVSLLRVKTFTTVIYNLLLAGFSLPAAAAASLLLLALVWLLVALQRWSLGRARYVQVGTRAAARPPAPIRLGRWRLPALLYLLLASGLAFFLPLAVLVAQVARLDGGALLGFLLQQGPYVRNSVVVAVVGATLALAVALAAGWLQWKGGSGAPGLVLQTGYAIPGTVLGLGLVGLSLTLLPDLYGTPALLSVAYALLYAGPAFQAARAALSQVAPAMEEAARALGRSPLAAACEVVFPLAGPGLVGAWLIAFILSARELAATLVLRPAGFDTLPVRVWVHTMDVGVEPRAAVVALLLIGLVGLSWLGALLLRPRGAPLTLG